MNMKKQIFSNFPMGKKIILAAMVALIIPSVLADYGHMMGYGYGMGGSIGIGLFGVVWFIIATFIFSLIFWSTYKWIVNERKGKTLRR